MEIYEPDTTQSKRKKKKRGKKEREILVNKASLATIKQANICTMGVPEGEEKGKGIGELFNETIDGFCKS